jgi:DNA polymerase
LKAELQNLYETERNRLLELKDLMGDYSSPVFGEGDAFSTIVLVGEAPGANEAEQGRVFVGKAGEQLNAMLALANLKREEIFITNAVKFRPIKRTKTSVSNRTPTIAEINASNYVLQKELELIKPHFVITLGNTALSAVIKATKANIKFTTLKEMQGKPRKLRAFDFRFTLYPVYHPASVIYNRELQPALDESLVRIPEILRGLGYRV